jgi:IS5 family transposase
MIKQITLSAIADELAQTSTRKSEFLDRINRIIPWSEWISKIKPHYYKGERGNKPFDLELMLRIHVIQNLYNLSDMAVMNEIIDSRSFSLFCGIDSSNQVPDGDTIGRFRAILTENGLQKQLFEQVTEKLHDRGLILMKGTIVDSTIISAPPSIKNREHKRDPEAGHTKKGNKHYFGYKAHIGVDKDTGIVLNLAVTAANNHDITVVPRLLTREEDEVYGDSGYIGAEKREDAVTHNESGKKIKYRINRRPSQSKHNSTRSRGQIKRWEREKSSIRAKVEHVFGVVKVLFGFTKTRYKGLAKQESKLNMMFSLANLYLADKRCASTG